jgi:hypothetical protein
MTRGGVKKTRPRHARHVCGYGVLVTLCVRTVCRPVRLPGYACCDGDDPAT